MLRMLAARVTMLPRMAFHVLRISVCFNHFSAAGMKHHCQGGSWKERIVAQGRANTITAMAESLAAGSLPRRAAAERAHPKPQTGSIGVNQEVVRLLDRSKPAPNDVLPGRKATPPKFLHTSPPAEEQVSQCPSPQRILIIEPRQSFLDREPREILSPEYFQRNKKCN